MNDNEAERIVRGERADAALTQFLRPAFDTCRASYLASMAKIAAKPLGDKDRAAITNLSIALRLIDEVETQIAAVVHDGQVALEGKRASDRIAALPAEQRKWAGW